jgi:hypothetical protein
LSILVGHILVALQQELGLEESKVGALVFV